MTKQPPFNLAHFNRRRPLFLFDGDCHFCRYWVSRWKSSVDDQVDFEPSQDWTVQLKEIPAKEFERAVQLILPSGEVWSGAAAVFKTLSLGGRHQWMWRLYQYLPGFRQMTEIFYLMVAKNRTFFSRLTRFLWGQEINPPSYYISTWIFLRLMGVIYLAAFASIAVQIKGLVGSQGIMPASVYLKQIAAQMGPERFYFFPTVFWASSTDTALLFVCITGIVMALFLTTGIAQALSGLVLWFLYLSIYNIANVFLGFQWDILLLETGFLLIFLSPLMFKPSFGREPAPEKILLFLMKLLAFKVLFFSGLVKILSGDQTWANLTALNFHYETQPLPVWISWFANQLPGWFQRLSAGGMFFIELIVPFFFFAPRRIRYAAVFSQFVLMFLIMLTGNYCFFNWLVISICLLMLDDSFYPARLRNYFHSKRNWSKDFPAMPWPKLITGGVGAIVIFLSVVTWPTKMGLKINWPNFMAAPVSILRPWQLVNSYGLFAVMTTTRPEIIIEGSNDGIHWFPYEFKYKPGKLSRRPAFVAPHQPRLDWQMWFAALGQVRQNPWFVNLCVRLLQGSQPVLALLEENPFPSNPPQAIRAMMYDYHYSNYQNRRKGLWWRRDNERVYLDAISLRRQ